MEREQSAVATRVLVYPAGTEIGLEVHRGLSGRHDIIAVGASDFASHAPSVFRHCVPAPYVGQVGWFEALQRIVHDEHIDVVYPAHDDAAYELSVRATELGVPLVTSPEATCRICRFKSATYDLLGDVVPVARRLHPGGDDVRYPVFVKPDRGQGSRGAQRVDTPAQLAAMDLSGQLVMEYLPGEEFTIDCLSDRDAGLLFTGGRRRERINAGISVRTEGVQRPEFADYARRIASRLALHGAWFFQVKASEDGQLRLLEVAPRIAGAMAYYRVQGVNFPLLSVYETLRRPFRVEPQLVSGLVLDRALHNRYEHGPSFDRVYVDLDDTLVVRGEVNTLLVRFVFQCINRGIPIALLTRHARELDTTLRAHRLTGLFDEVLHLREGETKSSFIRGPGAILVDDSFREREEVSSRLGIRTFDPSAIELLLDDRL